MLPLESRKIFGVCVKGLSFPTSDLSGRLIEWLETLRAVGADQVFLYEMSVHPNVSKVLDHYVRDGFVDLVKLRLPGPRPNTRIMQHLYIKYKVLMINIDSKKSHASTPYLCHLQYIFDFRKI